MAASSLDGTTRRAPRLPSDVRIAGHITRLGRFAQKDPTRGRRLPRIWAVLGLVAWAGWMGAVAKQALSDDEG